MSQIVHFQLIGARASIERDRRGLNPQIPLVLIRKGTVVDCDELAWKQGVRLGDTARQAKISAPSCQVIQEHEGDLGDIEPVLKVLSAYTPYVEPDEQNNSVFASLFKDARVEEVVRALDGLAFYIVAGESSSKLISKAASSWAFRQHLKNAKGRLKHEHWGSIRQGAKYILVSISQPKEFISNLPLDFLWMLPRDTVLVLTGLGIRKVKDLQTVPLSELKKHIGDWAIPAKEWATGVDGSRVKPMYPPPKVMRQVEVQGTVSQIQESLLSSSIAQLADYLYEEGLGLKKMSLTVSGSFPDVSGTKTFVRPVCARGPIEVAASSILRSILKDSLAQHLNSTVSAITLTAEEIEPVYSKKKELWGEPKSVSPAQPRKIAIPVELGLALLGVQDKFGDSAISWGRERERDRRFNSGIMRREQMLSIWDPMRAALTTTSEAGDGVANV